MIRNISAIMANPRIWMLRRPVLSSSRIATMYPGMAKTAKMPSWISVLSSSVAFGLSSLSISGWEMVFP